MKRLRYLWPGYRRAEEREMQEELAALEAIAGRRELGILRWRRRARVPCGAGSGCRAWCGTLRYALRVLARQPSFAVVAVVSLGLGIGANAAIYSLMDTLLWRQLPVSEPERLVRYPTDSYSYPVFREYAAKSQEYLESVIATTGILSRDLDAGSGPERGRVEMVSGSYFPGLGVAPLFGRMLTPEDDSATGANAVVLSYRYWQRAYGGERGAIGRTLRVGNVPFTIVGVARPEFFGVVVGEAAEAWAPMSTLPAVFPGQPWLDSHMHYLNLLGRLRPGVNAVQASAALTPLAVATELAFARPNMPARFLKVIREQKLKLEPAANGISYLRTRFSTPLRVLFTMVGIVLLLACVNVMSLGFARAEGRRTELRVRLAIGAARARIVRQLVTEALVVALAGGALGLAIYRPAASGLASSALADDRPAAGCKHAAVCVRDFAGGGADLRRGAGAGIDARARVGRIAVRLARRHASTGATGCRPRCGGGADGALGGVDRGGISVRVQLAEADQLRYRVGPPPAGGGGCGRQGRRL